jgi:hypothetical protein
MRCEALQAFGSSKTSSLIFVFIFVCILVFIFVLICIVDGRELFPPLSYGAATEVVHFAELDVSLKEADKQMPVCPKQNLLWVLS